MFSEEEIEKKTTNTDRLQAMMIPSLIPGNANVFCFRKLESAKLLTGAVIPRVVTKGPLTNVVRKTLLSSGFDSYQDSLYFVMQWSGPRQIDFYQAMGPSQIINHIPGQYQITRKDCLAEAMNMAVRMFPEYDNYFPKSYTIPGQEHQFKQQFKQGNYYIRKQATAARGEGVKLINNPEKIPIKFEGVIQEYITDPLLVDGRKFDLRLYVVVTSVEPLIGYVYKYGLARFASQEYHKPTIQNFENPTIHLTNYSVNKKTIHSKESQSASETSRMQDRSQSASKVDAPEELEKANSDEEGIDDIKWEMTELLDFIDNKPELFNQKFIDSLQGRSIRQHFMEQIDELIAKTLTAGEPSMHADCSAAMIINSYPRKCFGYYGFDVMLRKSGKVSLIEVNVQPSTATAAKLDKRVKYNLIADMWTLIGVEAHFNEKGDLINPKRASVKKDRPPSVKSIKNENSKITQFSTDGNRLSYKIQQLVETTTKQSAKNIEHNVVDIVDSTKLTKFELRALWQIFDEESRIGQFHRVLPLVGLKPCFQQTRYLNVLIQRLLDQGFTIEDMIKEWNRVTI